MTWKFGRQAPDNNLMRFVARRFPVSAVMLDIGSGEGANARELIARDHTVYTVDHDPHVDCDFHIDIGQFDIENLDCVYDINTLCHVENPPFEKIKSWLNPDGIFFSICPTDRMWVGVAEGKDFTRFASREQLKRFLKPFSRWSIDRAGAPDFRGHYLSSWIVEARP